MAGPSAHSRLGVIKDGVLEFGWSNAAASDLVWELCGLSIVSVEPQSSRMSGDPAFELSAGRWLEIFSGSRPGPVVTEAARLHVRQLALRPVASARATIATPTPKWGPRVKAPIGPRYLPVALPTGSLAQPRSPGGSRLLKLRRCRSRTGMYPPTPVGARVKPLTRAWICPASCSPRRPILRRRRPDVCSPFVCCCHGGCRRMSACAYTRERGEVPSVRCGWIRPS